MAFNNEDKVSYKELAPSLKRLFKNLEKEIRERQIGYIDDNSKYIGRLKDRLTTLENRDDLKELYKMAKNDDEESASGQVLKINPSKKSLYQHDEFLSRRIVSNQYEKEEEFGRIPDSMETVFKTWKRYAHFNLYATRYLDTTDNAERGLSDGQNLNQGGFQVYLNGNAWRFDKKTNMIVSTLDSGATAGFISPTADYYSYYIKTMVDTGWDDDNLMLVVGYTVDDNGKEHTLSLVRGAGNFGGDINNPDNFFIKDDKKYYKREGYTIPMPYIDYGEKGFVPGNPSINYPIDKWYDVFKKTPVFNNSGTWWHFDTIFWWGLIYDMGNDTQFIITDLSNEVGPSPKPTYGSRGCISYISALREGNYFKFTTSQWSEDGTDDKPMLEGTFEFSLPDEKPEHWSDEMFENMQKMCLEPSHVGFGCRSGTPRFTIMDQRGIFDDEDIYSLYEDKIFSFNSQKFSWEFKEKISENKNFTQKIFLYNPKLKTLYWYNDVFDYTRITMPPDLKELTRPGKDGQILKYNGRTDFLQYDDEFHICNVVDDDNDWNKIKNSKFSLKDVFDNWERISGLWDGKIPTSYKNQNLNTEGQIAARNAYTYDDTSGSIINHRNSDETTAFLSREYYKSFKFKLQLSHLDDDDDLIFVIVGFMTDDKGIQHDISVVRNGGGYWKKETGPLYIMYDAMSYLYTGEPDTYAPTHIRDHNSKDYKMLVLKGKEYGVIQPLVWEWGPVELEIERGKKRDGTPFLDIRTSNPNGHIDYNDPDFRLYYELPTSIPEYWTAEQYLNVRNMLTNESRVGFGTQSNECKFKILSQSGFLQDDLIYHLKKDRVYRRVDGNNWEEIGTVPEHMMSKVFMYNKNTKKLFWYEKESEDKATTEYIQLQSHSDINPQNIPDNEGVINSTIEVAEYYSQELTSSVKVVPITGKEISATIKIQ